MQLIAQNASEVCLATRDAEVPDALCAWLLDASGSELLARSAGALAVGLRIALILVIASLVTSLVRRSIRRFGTVMERRIEARLTRGEERGTLDRERFRLRRFQRLHAITGVARGLAGVLIWVTAILVLIDTLGFSLQPVLAGAGLISVVLGFGAQQLVRDVLAGIAMLIEDQYGVGDWIQVQDKIGQVERVGLRATSFRDLDGILWHTLNGSIDRVGNLSQEWSASTLDVPIALDADVPTAKAIIYKVATELAADPVWGQDIIGEPEIWGVQEFGPGGVAIRVVTPTKPMANWQVNRQLRERLHHAFEQAHIRMPAQLMDLGGQRFGYPVLNQRDDGSTGERGPRRRAGVRGEASAASGPMSVDDITGDPYAGDVRDQTTEMRLARGDEPRPD